MDPVTSLALGRIAAGAAFLARPELAAGLLGVDAVRNPQGAYLGRLFGSREVALGALTLAARGPARRPLLLAGLAVDAADAATAIAGIRDRSVSSRSGLLLLGPALGAIGAGVQGLLPRRR